MGPPENELPRLVNSKEKFSRVRFLMAWMDGAPCGLPGQVHRRLLLALDDKEIASGAAREAVDLADDVSFNMAARAALVQWLADGVTSSGTSCVSIVKCALAHVILDTGDASDALPPSALSREAEAAADQMLSAVRTTEFRGTLTVLLFHGREEVRVWARETLLRLIAEAEGDRAVWLIGIRLLCCIRHLAACPLDASNESAPCTVADGLCSLLAVLTAVDARLVSMEQAQLAQQQSAGSRVAEKSPSGRVEGSATAAAGPSSAAVLLLGGSMALHWLISAGPRYDTSGGGGARTCRALAGLVNARLGPATGLRPAALAADTRRGLVKTLVHCLIDHARSVGVSAGGPKETEAAAARRRQAHVRMCGIWHVAACVDAPPARPADPSAPPQRSAPAPERAAGWMLRVLYRNAAAQLSLPAAVRAAKQSGVRCAPDALRLMEAAAAALDLFFATLTAALPALAASRHFHEFLRAVAADCAAVACGVARRSARPEIGTAVLCHFLRADALAFSGGSAPAECLRAAWEALPALLRPPPLSPAQCAAPREVIRLVAEAVGAALQPAACAWMLLRPLRDGPQPIAAVVARCAERLAGAMHDSMAELQRAWESDSGSAAGELLMSGSPLPRVAHALMASHDAALRRLGEAFAALFLRTMEPEAQCIFRSDAADWMLRVILDSQTLVTNALQLHNPVVDAAARADGAAWVNIMCLCNWENLSTDTLARAWWLCALVADVCVLEQTQRDRLLETAITKLPAIPEVDKDEDGAGEKRTRHESHAVTRRDTRKDDEATEEKERGNAEKDSFSNGTTRRALRDCAQHLFIVLVRKTVQFTPGALVAALLHIAGAIPPPQGNDSFRRALRTPLVAAVQRLPADLRRTLTNYAPPWLAEMLQSAQRSVTECEADHSRRLQQYAVEERRLAQLEEVDRRRAEQDSAARRVNEMCRVETMAAERDEAAQRGAVTQHAGTKRTRPECVPLMHAMPASELRAPQRQTVSFTSLAPPPNTQTLCATECQSPTKVTLVDLLQRIAGKTEPRLHPPRTDDIIGYGRHCIAKEVPIIPRRFAGRDSYAAAFAPHIALEMRYEIHSKFEEVAAACRTGTRTERNAEVIVKASEAHVAQWVYGNTVTVQAASEATAVDFDPTELQFSITTAFLRSEKELAQQHISSALSDGDVALLLLPLADVAAALPHAFRVGTIPYEWQLLGCVPQICLVRSVHPAQRCALLHLFTSTNSTSSSVSSSSKETVSVTFLHALHAFRTSRKSFFVRRLSSLGSATSSMTAVQSIARTSFARAVFEPHVEARTSRAYHEALEQIFASEQWSPVSRALVLRDRLNEWQARAVAAALFFVVPGWDSAALHSASQLHANAHAQFSKQTVESASGVANVPKLSASLPPAPSFFIIEGPPGTGKTQTIAVLSLNLLRFLPSRSRRRRVLICAPSNCAVDEVLLRVRALAALNRSAVGDVRLLRVGVRDRVAPEVLAANPPVFFDDCAELAGSGVASSRDTLAGNRVQQREQILQSAHITCSTLGSLAQIQRQHGIQYDVVVVDETSQAKEPEVLQALMLAESRAILVGDSKQLQPTVLCRAAAARGLRRSLLQRVLREGGGACMLREQYRMHPDICAFPNRYIYGGKLLTGTAAGGPGGGGWIAARAAANLVPRGLMAAPRFVFVDVPGGRMEWGRGNSAVNRREASAVVAQMRHFRTALRLTPEQFGPHIGIITFYRSQKDTLVQMLSREERESRLQIATVDSFQGREKSIIFISCVRAPRASSPSPSASTNEPVSLGFIEDWHRVNVALTRAKEFCVVFGNKDTFQMAAKESRASPAEEGGGDERIEVQSLPSADDDVQVMDGPPAEKADNDPQMLDRLVQHAEGIGAEFRDYGRLNLAMNLMCR